MKELRVIRFEIYNKNCIYFFFQILVLVMNVPIVNELC